MATPRVMCDKTELVLMIPGKNKIESLNLPSSRITRIQFDPCTERVFLFPKESEKITIVTPAREQPVVYTKMKNKQLFEQYKADLRQFAKDNRITFTDNLT